jgi:hypothetical protein
MLLEISALIGSKLVMRPKWIVEGEISKLLVVISIEKSRCVSDHVHAKSTIKIYLSLVIRPNPHSYLHTHFWIKTILLWVYEVYIIIYIRNLTCFNPFLNYFQTIYCHLIIPMRVFIILKKVLNGQKKYLKTTSSNGQNNTIHAKSMESWFFSWSWSACYDVIHSHYHLSGLTCGYQGLLFWS